MNLPEIQSALQERKLDGWLFADFRGSDPLAYSVLGLPAQFRSRRWYYYIPAKGEPAKLVHAIETGSLDAVPGSKTVYLAWPNLHENLKKMLAGAKRVAMQYSPNNNIPYVSRVDAGTIELIRSFGVEVASSAELIQLFEARLTDEQIASHYKAANLLGAIVQDAFGEIGRRLKRGEAPTEYEIQQFIWTEFDRQGLVADHAPIVAINEHAADPHFEPNEANSKTFGTNQSVLIDAWCKLKKPGSIMADITWVGYIGKQIPEKYQKVFEIVRDARDAGINCVINAFEKNKPLQGCEVDDATRAVIDNAGYGQYYIHRTGHSIHEMTHGNGTHIDNLETHDTRPIIPRTCFSIEPGIYLPGEFGVRSEIDILVPPTGLPLVTGLPAQEELIHLKM